jgi:hypothetical protein
MYCLTSLFVCEGLEFGHEYLIDVLAINELGETWDEQKFSAKTAGKLRHEKWSF